MPQIVSLWRVHTADGLEKTHLCWKPVENQFLSRGTLLDEDVLVKFVEQMLTGVVGKVSYTEGVKKEIPTEMSSFGMA